MGGTTIIRIPPHALHGIGLNWPLRATGMEAAARTLEMGLLLDPEEDEFAMVTTRAIPVPSYPGRRGCNRA
jgi:hypothetical protein